MRPPAPVAGVLLAAALAGCAAEPAPNVLLVVVDTLRRDHLGCYGYGRDTSPHIDRLAAGAVRYEHAYAAASWTTPSVGSLLTSLYPTELGILLEPNRLDDRFVLLSEVLAAEGYATAAVVSHYFLGSQWNFGQGFESFDETNVLGHAGVSSPGVTASALAFLRRPREGPFFLFVHYFDPHYDYQEHAGHRFSRPGYDGPLRPGMAYEELMERLPGLTAADRDRLVDLYDSEVAFTDEHVGRLLAGLDELGLAGDTLVVLTADHGEELLDRGNIGHGHALYEEQIAVPLIVRDPAAPPGVVATSVGLIDVLPTLLARLGIAPPARISGRRLPGPGAAEAAGPGAAARLVFSQTDWGRFRSAVGGRLKLHHHLPTGRRRLYDLAADPGELHDLLPAATGGAAPDPAADHVSFAELHALRTGLTAWMAAMDSTRHDAESLDLGDEERAKLRALGYLRSGL